MRKMILMAIAGYFWKKFQARGIKPTNVRGVRRSY